MHNHRFNTDRLGVAYKATVTCAVIGCRSRHTHKFIDSARAKYVRCRCGMARFKSGHGGILFVKTKHDAIMNDLTVMNHPQQWFTPHRPMGSKDIRPTSEAVLGTFNTPPNVQAERQGWVLGEWVGKTYVKFDKPMSPSRYARRLREDKTTTSFISYNGKAI